MEAGAGTYEQDPHSMPRSRKRGAGGGTDPWVGTRAIAVQCAASAREKTFNKRTGKPSLHWPKEAGKQLMSILSQEKYQHLPKPAKPAEYCARWGKKFQLRQSVKDAPRSGRKRKVPDSTISDLVKLVTKVNPKRQKDMETHPDFVTVVNTYKVKPSTIWHHMCELEPRLDKCVAVEFKRPLKLEHIEARARVAREWLDEARAASSSKAATDGNGPGPAAPFIPRNISDLNLSWIRRIIWIDAKKFYIQPRGYKAWGLKGAPSIVLEDPRLKGKPWVINYYSAVNYTHGGLLLVLVSGTRGTGYTPAKTYKVG